MTAKKEKETVDQKPSARRTTRHKHCNYPSEVYAARLTLDDAKILDDYAKKHNLERADVVRLGLHQFALRQHMLGGAKDTVRERQEQIISEQIEPMKTRFDELAKTLNALTKHISDNHQQDSPVTANDQIRESQPDQSKSESISHFEQLFVEQQKMLERILLSATLALRFIVNYSVDPILRNVNTGKTDELTMHLRAADMGGEYWSEATRQVVRRTGNRILLELNFLPKEEESGMLNNDETASSKTFEGNKR